MPIKSKDNIQVVFGTGDILVTVGCKEDGSSAVAHFRQSKERPIGERIETDETMMKIDDAPVSFIFNKIESLDAVIFQLQKLRDIMGNGSNYEWQENRKIIEKK